MDTMTAIRTRRSIRKYEDMPIPDGMVREILDAAMMAPSAGNAQPWQFVVINDRAILANLATIHPYVKMAAKAQLGILICGDLSLEKYQGYWVQDCSAAMQNMLLAIHSLGLGAVWTGIYPMENRVAAFAEELGLPKDVIPLGFAPIGWPAHQPTAESRFREDRIHYNTY